MRWDAALSCDSGGGASVGDDVDDGGGTLTLTGKQLLDLFPDEFRGDPSCVFTVELLRIRNGTMDDDFPATLATGIQERTFDVRVVP